MKTICLVAWMLLFSLAGFAQSYQKTGWGFKTMIDTVEVEVQFYSPSIVRIIKAPAGQTFTKESLSVIKKPSKTGLRINQRGNLLEISSEKIRVNLNVKSGNLQFYTITGNMLLQEKDSSAVFTPFDDAGDKTFSVSQAFRLEPDEAIYGLGQQQRGRMIQRNLSMNMVQNNTEDYVPFIHSVKGYGLFWDNYSPTRFTDNPQATTFKSDVGDCIDYYFMYGGNADGVIAGMRDLTGQAPMFPLWTYGYWQSKERYKSQEEIVGVGGIL